jgi:hypothetical protein
LLEIVLTCIYESIISSDVTILPPYQVIKSFQELIYKIFGVGNNTYNSELESLFRQSEILEKFNTSLAQNLGDFGYSKNVAALSQCNTTLIADYPYELITEMRKITPMLTVIL